MLRVTAGVRQDSLERLGRPSSQADGVPEDGEDGADSTEDGGVAAAVVAALQAAGRGRALAGVGTSSDRHLAAGGRLSRRQSAAAQLASLRSAPEPLLARLSSFGAGSFARPAHSRAPSTLHRRSALAGVSPGASAGIASQPSAPLGSLPEQGEDAV